MQLNLFLRNYYVMHTPMFYVFVLFSTLGILGFSLEIKAESSAVEAVESTKIERTKVETIKDAWAIALQQNPELLHSRAMITAAEKGIKAQQQHRLPSLSLTSQFQSLEEPVSAEVVIPGHFFTLPGFPPAPDRTTAITSDKDFFLSQLELNLPIYTGGKISALIERAEIHHLIEKSKNSNNELKVKIQTVEAYLNVLRSKHALLISKDHMTVLNAHTKDVNALFEKGIVANNDLLAVELALIEGEQNVLKAKNGVDLAAANYNQRLGRSLTQPFQLQQHLPAVALSSFQHYKAVAPKNRLELKLIDFQQQLIEAQLAIVKSERRPQFGLTLNTMQTDADFLEEDRITRGGIGMQWQLWGGKNNPSQVQQLIRQKEAVKQQRISVESLVLLEVQQAWIAVNENKNRITVLQKAQDVAEENLRVNRLRYRNGVGTNRDVLDSELIRNLRISDYHNARFDLILSYYRLKAAAGEL